jgi:hypothetical protein
MEFQTERYKIQSKVSLVKKKKGNKIVFKFFYLYN